ncbi:MAG: type VI secretion system Vgr family protein [Polyangiaceae bacterium]
MQISISLSIDGQSLPCESVQGREAVGEPTRLTVVCYSDEPLDPASRLDTAVALYLQNDYSERTIVGVVRRIARVAKWRPGVKQSERGYRYRVTLESALGRLEHTRQCRVFQGLSLLEIARQALVAGGWDPSRIEDQCAQTYEPLDYVVQYDETDLAFFRRICERAGFYAHLEAAGDPAEERCILSDTSTTLVSARDPLQVAETGQEELAASRIRRVSIDTQLRPGRVTLRDYDPTRPKLDLKGGATTASELPRQRLEAAAEHYSTHARLKSPVQGDRESQLMLEAFQQGGAKVGFESNALDLRPGIAIDAVPASSDVTSIDGSYVLTAIEHGWSAGEPYWLKVTAQPVEKPIRLPRVTPVPNLAGVHSAWITVPDGEEVHVDELGRGHARFRWDLRDIEDHTGSLPIRVMQQLMVDSMALPRSNWEVLVGFEQGDPERPMILGRMHNANHPPTYALPENKNVTAIRTFSPGGKSMNSIQTSDGKGGQRFAINAASGKDMSAGGDHGIETGKVEEQHTGHQTVTVGGNEEIKVNQKYAVTAASQSGTVGGSQKVGVTGKLSHNVGSETISIGGALLEQIGSPEAIAVSLASTAMQKLAGSNFLGKRLGKVGSMAAQFVAPMGKAAYEGYKTGGLEGAMKSAAGAGAQTAMGMVAGKVPGGDAALAGAMAAGGDDLMGKLTAPNAKAGGAGGADGDGAGAEAGGAGNKEFKVSGAALEAVGGAHVIVTPASVDWETLGSANLLVGGLHGTRAGSNASLEVGGASMEASSAHMVKSGGPVERKCSGTLSTTCAALSINSSAHIGFKAGGGIDIDVGALTLSGGSVTFDVEGTIVSFDGGGVKIDAGTVTFKRATKQSGATKH